MALINIQTNLKSLTYGEFGAQDPLVTKRIDGSASSSGIELEGVKRVDDLKRITKLLTQTPAAIKFGANQAALNTLEQRIKSNKKGSLGGDIVRGIGNTVKVLASTLAQVPVNGTGTHLVKGFAGKLGYLAGVQGHVEYKNNRNQDGIINIKGKIEDSEDFNASKSITVLQYFEDIPGQTKTSKNAINKKGLEKNVIQSEGSFQQYDQKAYYSQSLATDTNSNLFINSNAGFNYTDPSKSFDIITAKAPTTSSIEEASAMDIETAKVFEDLIKFRIKIISPQITDGGEPTVTHLNFRAFLDSFNDEYSAEWSNHKYIGRAEDFYTYGGFSRGVSFGFKVAALSRTEVDPLYEKLNLLVGQMAPTYVGSSFMRGNFATVTIGDYLINQTGFFTSVSLSWSTDYMFGGQNNDSQLPHILDVQCQFQPVHSFNTTFGEKYVYNVGNNLGGSGEKSESKKTPQNSSTSTGGNAERSSADRNNPFDGEGRILGI